jgi:SAM-dependent methyltransferase
LCGDLPRPWLEIGVGTGRFAVALGVDIGVDPAFNALLYAKRRGVQTLRALGQALPFENRTFGAVFVVVTLCFANDAEGLLREAARVTRAEGGIVLGIVPAESPWGNFYAAKGRAGHPFYSEARFFTLEEVRNLARGVELHLERSVSTLFGSPAQGPFEIEHPQEHDDRKAGFVVMLFRPSREDQSKTASTGA